MQPSYSSIGQIFSAQLRYVVPLFQRPYVWSKEHQWQPLWDDIQELADRVLDPPPHKPVAGHFLGTAVLEQVATPAVEMPQRRVIDGQQRLTTLQILLKAGTTTLYEIGQTFAEDQRAPFTQAAGKLQLLCTNQFADIDEAKFKVWPTNDDRQQFRSILEWDPHSALPSGTKMAEAFVFFRNELRTWITIDRIAQRASAIAAALTDHVRMIVLDLDQYDEPQAIFETLNAHGTPLLPADLIKNWLLWEAGKQEVAAAPLYESYWAQFDRDHEYWRKEVGTGHAARPRVDTFLQNWLTLEGREIISAKHIYDRFLAHVSLASKASPTTKIDLADFMSALQADAERYRCIDTSNVGGDVGERIRRLNKLDYVVFRPFLIGLLRHETNDPTLVRDAITALESYLVRRMVCNEQTRGYGKVAVELVSALQDSPNEQKLDTIRSVLNSSGWPSDERFSEFWLKSRFYRYFRQVRVLTILQALEKALQSRAVKSEKVIVDVDKLTIEHVMPQGWQQNWPLPETTDFLTRETLVQNIGNLTLVNDRLNPSLSNGGWIGGANPKRDQIAKYSKLELNRLLLDGAGDNWDEAKIVARASQLFEVAREVWPAGSETAQ